MSNEIMAVSEADVTADIRSYDVRELEGGKLAAYCSVRAETMAEKALVFNAANNPQHKVNDFINKLIMLKDVYAETLELVNQETGEYEKAPRIVLIDENGEAYECVSVGM
ncbi:ssDNA binding protein, partial [gut metagenome]